MNYYFFVGTRRAVSVLRERPLLQGVPSPKPIHGIGFGFTLCGALKRYAGLRPAPHQRRCLWTPPKGRRPFGIPMLVLLNYGFTNT